MIHPRISSTLAALFLMACAPLSSRADKAPAGSTERLAEVNGVKLHYFIGGKGSAVVLLHGYAETSHMWFPIMPLLAKNHTVIVPDLRGAGDSSKPESGYDKKNMAVDIHALVVSLGFNRAEVVGRRAGKGGVLERLAFSTYAAVMVRPRLFEWLMRAARTFGIMPPLGAWTRFRDLRPLAPQSFREQWRTRLRDEVSG